MDEPLPEWEMEILGLPLPPDNSDVLLARAIAEDTAMWGLRETVSIWGWRLVNEARRGSTWPF